MITRSYFKKGYKRLGEGIALIILLAASPLFGLTLTDATGEKIDFEAPPERIVSLNPDFTENLFALGEGGKVVGVTGFCDYPPPAREIEQVGNLWSPSLEKILSLSPDLVLATKEGNSRRTVDSLRKLGLRVWVAGETRSLEDYSSLLEELGKILGREQKVAALRSLLDQEIIRCRTLNNNLPRKKVFFQLGIRPIVSVNRDTLIHQLIEAAGGDNLAASAPTRYPALSREKIIAEDPEYIILAVMGDQGKQARSDWEKYANLRAVREGHIYQVDPDLFCRLTPRLLEGFKQLRAILNPRRPDGSSNISGL